MTMMMRRNHTLTQTFLSSILMLFIGLLSLQAKAADIGTQISYQGRLDDVDVPANGSYDFKFSLYDAVSAGSQVGSTLSQTLTVTDGIFDTLLDFGAGVFNNQARFLEIEVQASGGGGYATLTPRQAFTTVPHATATQALGNLLVVAKSGGDYTTIGAALTAISGALVDNPYLIRVGPGIYEESIDLKSYVDIEGSGEGVTIVRGTGGATSPFTDGTSATVRSSGAVVAEIRQLSVESIATSNYAISIWTKDGGADLRIKNVDASASAGTSENIGVFNSTSSPTMTNVNTTATGVGSNYGVYNYSSSSPLMTHVIATGSGGSSSYGVINYSGSNPTMKDVTASATGGTKNTGVRNDINSNPTIRDSSITGSTNSVTNDGTSSARIGHSMLDSATAGAGFSCIGAYTDNFVALDENCLLFFAIGDTGPAGGIVFHITDGGLHGLEAAPVDQTQSQWCSTLVDITGVDNITSAATPDSHSGSHNTPLIEAVCGASSAAGVAANYAWPNGQNDGFLPNKEELNLLYAQKAVVGGFAGGYCWGSSESDGDGAWAQSFSSGSQNFGIKDTTLRVRAVRAF